MKSLCYVLFGATILLSGCATRQTSPSNIIEVPIPSNSPLSKIKKGMGLQQVISILGPPTDQGSNATGKAFIPFYFGSDSVRTKLYYNGLGQVQLGSGISGGGPKVNKIVYDPNEDGYEGDFTGESNVVATGDLQSNTQPLSARFRGVWSGSISQNNAGSFQVQIKMEKEPFMFENLTLNCSGIATLVRETDNTAEITANVTVGKARCTNTATFKLVYSDKDRIVFNAYYLNGQLAASGALSRK
jgi:hypothetical protein